MSLDSNSLTPRGWIFPYWVNTQHFPLTGSYNTALIYMCLCTLLTITHKIIHPCVTSRAHNAQNTIYRVGRAGWWVGEWRDYQIWSIKEKTLESPLDSKRIKPVNSTGNQAWIFIGRTDAEAEAPILWPHDAKSWFIGKDSWWKRLKAKEKQAAEDEMFR